MSPSRTSREDIVITGLGCRFAESPNPAAFWRAIMCRQASFSPNNDYPQNTPGASPHRLFDRPYPTHIARLGNLYACSPTDQQIPRKPDDGENPDIFFAIQLAIDALRDGGSTINRLPTDRVSLRLGYAPPFNVASVNWLQHTLFIDQTLGIIQKFFPNATGEHLDEVRKQLAGSLSAPHPNAFLSALGGVITARIADQLGLAGPAFAIDAGAASGIQAIQGAMDDLTTRRSDIALAGAIQPPLHPTVLDGLSGAITFSRGKTLQPFSRESSGTLPGEGGVFFVLKRLKDALRQRDRIYAIVRSTGIVAASVDQHLRVPTAERLMRALSRALHAADVTPDSIQMIEAHGSGIPHSDQTELQVLQEIFSERAGGRPAVGMGSVKGNIGHTLWASSAAGTLKAALAIASRTLAPHIPTEKPYARLSTAKSPLYLLTDARPWIRGNKKMPRRACVTAIDVTGTCAAAILEEYPEEP